MVLKSLINLRNICRMCGERYDEECKSVDIFQPGADNGPSYADLMKIHLDLEPRDGDGKPQRIGETCANLLDEWTDFKKKILETQKELLKLQQRRLLLKIAAKAIQTAEVNEPEDCKAEERVQEEATTSRASSRIAAKRKASTEDGESSGPSRRHTSGKNKKTTHLKKKKNK